MFPSKNSPFQITKPTYEEPLSGLVATVMLAGALVTERDNGTVGDPTELVACGAGQRPAILELNVVSAEDWQTYMNGNPDTRNPLRTPVPVGTTVSARYAKYAEFEGASYFTGIDGTSPAKMPLKVVAGKFVEADITLPDAGGTVDRVVAYLVKKIAPRDPASFRWLVEFAN